MAQAPLTSNAFKELDNLQNMAPRPAKKGAKERHVAGGNKNDSINGELVKCNKASEIGALLTRFGIRKDDIVGHAKSAPNFGQFRMWAGNKMRGVANRLAQAKEMGLKVVIAQIAYPEDFKALLPKKEKPVKTNSKKTASQKKPVATAKAPAKLPIKTPLKTPIKTPIKKAVA